MFGPERDKIIRGWRKLHNETHLKVYSSAIIITAREWRRIRMGWA
jgi:hypothetical protein